MGTWTPVSFKDIKLFYYISFFTWNISCIKIHEGFELAMVVRKLFIEMTMTSLCLVSLEVIMTLFWILCVLKRGSLQVVLLQ